MNRIVAPPTVNVEEGQTSKLHERELHKRDSILISQSMSTTQIPNLLPNNWLEMKPSALAQLGDIQSIEWPRAYSRGVSLSIKRDDLVDSELGGNKVYKLYGHLRQYLSSFNPNRPLTIATFGGAYSNHIYALAEAAKRLSLPCVGVIRGEEPKRLSPTLEDARKKGMKLVFVPREDYKRRGTDQFRYYIERQIGKCFWVPEGGGGELGQIACRSLGFEIARRVESDIESKSVTVCLACGTATTMSGVIDGIFRQLKQRTSNQSQKIKVLGISALKSRSSLVRTIYTLSDPKALLRISWQISNQFHLGGYAKTPKPLLEFMSLFEQQTQVPLDKVYTAKLCWAIDQHIEREFWLAGERIVAIHSGGLQGNRKAENTRI